MLRPKVSICIPSYNSEKHIKKTLDSVLSQTYENIEVIIVDDCSTDKTREIISGYSDQRIHFYVNEKNMGLSQNWNKSVELSTGEYIKLLCADDLLENDCIEKEILKITSDNSISMVICDTYIFNENGDVVLKVKRLPKEGKYDGKKIAKKALLFKNYFGAPCNVLFKRETFLKVGGFDNEFKYIPDFDLWLKLAYEGYVYHISEFLSYFKVHSVSNTNQLMTNGQDIYTDEHLKLVNKHGDMGVVKISEFDKKVHVVFRRLRNFMVSVFLKYFSKR